jgi:hypothetical protein
MPALDRLWISGAYLLLIAGSVCIAEDGSAGASPRSSWQGSPPSMSAFWQAGRLPPMRCGAPGGGNRERVVALLAIRQREEVLPQCLWFTLVNQAGLDALAGTGKMRRAEQDI